MRGRIHRRHQIAQSRPPGAIAPPQDNLRTFDLVESNVGQTLLHLRVADGDVVHESLSGVGDPQFAVVRVDRDGTVGKV
jgi:hypothetical protein